MKIYLASDHGGYFYKEEIQKHLEGKGYAVEDVGNLDFVKEDDYPDFVIPLAEKVAKDKKSLGIVLGRSGNGELIAANKVKGARAVMGCSAAMVKKAKEDNDPNILSLGADFLTLQQALDCVEVFLKTSFSKVERHARRVKKITDYESSKS
jgi:ribose 5-phosphate isomerase B